MDSFEAGLYACLDLVDVAQRRDNSAPAAFDHRTSEMTMVFSQ